MIYALAVLGYVLLGAFNGYVCGRVHFTDEKDRPMCAAFFALVVPIGFPVSLAWFVLEAGERAKALQQEKDDRAKELRGARHRLELAALTEQTEDVKRLSDGK
jgi:hypothetical protein